MSYGLNWWAAGKQAMRLVVWLQLAIRAHAVRALHQTPRRLSAPQLPRPLRGHHLWSNFLCIYCIFACRFPAPDTHKHTHTRRFRSRASKCHALERQMAMAPSTSSILRELMGQCWSWRCCEMCHGGVTNSSNFERRRRHSVCSFLKPKASLPDCRSDALSLYQDVGIPSSINCFIDRLCKLHSQGRSITTPPLVVSSWSDATWPQYDAKGGVVIAIPAAPTGQPRSECHHMHSYSRDARRSLPFSVSQPVCLPAGVRDGEQNGNAISLGLASWPPEGSEKSSLLASQSNSINLTHGNVIVALSHGAVQTVTFLS